MKDLLIIFDFDGTIAKTVKFYKDIAGILADEFGFRKVKSDEIEELRNKKPKDILKTLEISWIKIPFILRRVRSLFSKEIEKIELVEGIEDVLSYLRNNNYRLGILTSNSRENVKKLLEKNNIDFFNFIFSEKSIFNKDKILFNLLKKEKINPERVVFISDETRDIEAAKKAKVKIIAVTWGLNKEGVLREQNPDYLAKNPKDLIKILSKP